MEMYRTILSPLCKKTLGNSEAVRIKALENLTPGDFHIVAEKFSLMGEAPSHSRLIGSLEEETRHKPRSGKIVAFGA